MASRLRKVVMIVSDAVFFTGLLGWSNEQGFDDGVV
jgi:hypothetical protein